VAFVEKLNHWLTLLANLGVIAGLFVVAFEIRQNTGIARATAYRENVQDIAAWRELMIVDPEVAQLYYRYMSEGIDGVEEQDRGRIGSLINNILGIYENAWLSRRYGVIGDEEWERFEAGVCQHYLGAVENERSLRYLTAAFVEYLDGTCRPAPG